MLAVTINFLLFLVLLLLVVSMRRSVHGIERNIAELITILLRKEEQSAQPGSADALVHPESAALAVLNTTEPNPEELNRLAPTRSLQPVAEKVPKEPRIESAVSADQASAVAAGARVSRRPTVLERCFAWYREDWMQKTGAIVVFLGFLWLVGYFNIWEKIGPAGQVTFGLLSGAAFLVFGWWRMQRFIDQGGTFMLLGSGIVLLTVFISRNVYPDMFDPRVATLVMLASVALVALAAVKYDRRSLAYVSQVAAFVIPVLAVSDPDDMMLFTYLLLVTAGTLWVVWLKGWRGLIVLALAFVSFYSVSYWDYLPDARLLLFGYLFSAIFFLAFAISIVRRGPSQIRWVDIVAILGNGVFITMWIHSGVKEELQSLVLAFWAALFAAGAYVTSLVSGRRDPFFLHGAVAIVMLAIATAKQFSGPALTIAYTFEAAAVAYAGYIATKRIETMEKLSALLLIPGAMALEHLFEYSNPKHCFNWYSACESQTVALLGKDFFGVLIFIVVSALLGVFIQRIRKATAKESNAVASAMFLVSSILALLLYRAFMHNAFSEGIAVFIVLVTYTAIGIALHFTGQIKDSKVLRWYGNILILLVLVRIFTVEFWILDIGPRILVAFGVGALLMATAFFRKG